MLSNTAVPRYYGAFRDAVLRGDIHVCKEVAMEMWRIDRLIESPGYYYDDRAVEGWIEFCENELTLSPAGPLPGDGHLQEPGQRPPSPPRHAAHVHP